MLYLTNYGEHRILFKSGQYNNLHLFPLENNLKNSKFSDVSCNKLTILSSFLFLPPKFWLSLFKLLISISIFIFNTTSILAALVLSVHNSGCYYFVIFNICKAIFNIVQGTYCSLFPIFRMKFQLNHQNFMGL